MHWFGGCCGSFWPLWGGFGGMGMFGMFFGGLLFLALLAGGILLIVGLVRQVSAGGASRPLARSSATARQILDERYARGEITREEYLTALADIERGG